MSIIVTDSIPIDSESIKPLSVLHSGLKREWQPILPTFCGQNKFKKKLSYAIFSVVANN